MATQACDKQGNVYNVIFSKDNYLRLRKADSTVYHLVLRESPKIINKDGQQYYFLGNDVLELALVWPLPEMYGLQKKSTIM